MNNVIERNEERDFFVWVDPQNIITKRQIENVGKFISTPSNNNNETLMFIPNPKFKGFLGFSQNNLLNNYIAEYNLELCRLKDFQQYPSRLQAIFLFDTEDEATKYKTTHPEHVGNHLLKRVKTIGNYTYSKHDSSWIDFLRSLGGKDPETIHNCTTCYWNGTLVKDCKLLSLGNPWTQDPIMETLFLGIIEFYDRNL